MKPIAITILCSIVLMHGVSQPATNTNCEPLEEANKHVWFNDNYFPAAVIRVPTNHLFKTVA